MSVPILSKSDVRARALRQRQAIAPDAARAAAEAAALHAAGHILSIGGRVVALYHPVRGELDTAPLAALLRAKGLSLALPVVIDAQGALTFRLWEETMQLTPGYGRIPELPADAPACLPDAVVTPLAAFDGRGFRLGYGQGHYDRTLAQLKAQGSLYALGYAYAAQQVPDVPDEPHDVPLDAVVTELGILSFSR